MRIASWETPLSRASNITQRAYYFYAPYAPEGKRDVRTICLLAAHAARIRATLLGGSPDTYAEWIPDQRPDTG